MESEAISLSANLGKAREGAASSKVELDALCAKAGLDAKKHNVASTKVREERQDEVAAWLVTTSRSKETLAKVRGGTSAEVAKFYSERDSCVSS